MSTQNLAGQSTDKHQTGHDQRQFMNLIQVFVVGLTLALAWYWGQSPSFTYLGGLVVLVAMALCFRFPQLGLLAIIPAALVITYSIGTGTQTGLNAAFLIIPILWVIVLVRSVYYHLSWGTAITRETLPLIGLVVTTVVSMVSGYLPWTAFAQQAPFRAQLGALGLFAAAAGICILAAIVIDSERWLQALVWLFLGLGSIYLVGRAVPNLARITTFFVEASTGSVFWIWLMVLAAGQAFFNQSLGLRIRSVLVGVVALNIFVSFINPESRSWVSGWLPSLIGLGIIVLLRWPKLSVGLGVAVTIIVILNFRWISTTLLSGDNAYSLLTREAALRILIQIVQVNPLFGVGPANYYYYTPLYSILGYYVRFNSHNQYLDIIAQVGLLGLFFYLWFNWEIGRSIWKLRQRLPTNGFAAGYLAASLAGLIAMLVAGGLGDWIIPFVYNIGVAGFRASELGWLFLGGAIALCWIYRKPVALEN